MKPSKVIVSKTSDTVPDSFVQEMDLRQSGVYSYFDMSFDKSIDEADRDKLTIISDYLYVYFVDSIGVV